MSRAAPGAARRPAAPFFASLAAGVLLLAWCYAEALPLRAGVAFHHVASVRELAKGEFPPANNLVPGRTPVGHYGPYLVALGWLARLSGLDPFVVLECAGLLLLAVFLLAFRALAARLVSPAAAEWSVPAALLLWGPWPGPDMPWVAWGWPGTTSPADAQNFFYPQHAALTLLVALLLVAVGGPTGGRRLALLALLATLLITTHPYSGLALAPAVASLACAWALRRERPLWSALALLLVPAAGMMLAVLWPYYPVWRLLEAFADPNFRQPLPPATAATVSAGSVGVEAAGLPAWHVLGPALLGLVGAVQLARRGRPFLLLWSVAALFLAFFPLVPLRERLVTFAALPLQMAATGLLAALWAGPRAGRAALALLLAATGFATWRRIEVVRDMEALDLGFVARSTPDEAVVLASDLLSNAVAGLTGRKVVCPEGPDLFLIMAGGAARMRDQDVFFRPGTPPEERARILKRWKATHVLVDRLGPRPVRLPYPVVAERDALVLYDARVVGAER
ncbi:MAG TPA: hypothetical protein VFM88_08165 [Vicinamibacteria bacterium]|nr:hypothetical protein [Vicinamibacteria bacterium]